MRPNRYLEVRGAGSSLDEAAARVAQYLPANYEVAGSFHDPDGRPVVQVEGNDVAGWTVEDYVAPRLGSGLMAATEVTEGA